MKVLNKKRAKNLKYLLQDQYLIPTYVKEYVSQTLDLEKTARICCFMHDERTPSLHFMPKSNSWACFGECNTGGDVSWMHYKYLKSLLDKGEFGKYKNTTKIKMNELNYYTAMEELGFKKGFIKQSIFDDEEDIVKCEIDLDKALAMLNTETKDTTKTVEIDLVSEVDYMYTKIDKILKSLKYIDKESYIKFTIERVDIATYGKLDGLQLIKERLDDLYKRIHLMLYGGNNEDINI